MRRAMGSMRETTVVLRDKYQLDFVEGKQNRYADDAGPDHNMGFAMARHSDQRLDDLLARDIPLFFGRLWLDSDEDYHLGRRHVRDEDDRSVPLVIDWRAPLAERFYRASAHHRHEVARRRRFGFDGNTLTAFEDEDLRLGQDFTSGLLTSEIERPRTGPMRDIVATIQPEQDELIRRDADTTLCVQGAPGTGKTAVGLHRAAWLLYSYPGRLTRSGMLVVGPNDGFLRYISGVLPTLGETSVSQTTVDELTGATTAAKHDAPEVERLKHDARMTEVCHRAVWSHLGEIEEGITIAHAGERAHLDVETLTVAIDRARRTSRTWDSGRKSLERTIVQALVTQLELRARRSADSKWAQSVRRSPEVKEFLTRTWPVLTAKQLLRRLYADRGFRALVTEAILTAEEAELLHQQTKPTQKLSPADVLVLDELQSLIKTPTSLSTYAHVVVDEAQDLSPMQCRAVARRCPNGALTVLGDLAQGTTPWAATHWPTQMGHLGRPDAEHTELTIGYRVPGAIIDLANLILPHLGVDVSPARSLRADGEIEVLTGSDLPVTTGDAVAKALVEPGLVGVIATETTLDHLRANLPTDQRVELVPAGLAKGLEFDHVILVEPADIVDTASTRENHAPDSIGLRHLYVALTRAVSRLTIVHTKPMPEPLDAPHHGPRR
ncbi:HelD family protein [Nocardioides pakistanensis]